MDELVTLVALLQSAQTVTKMLHWRTKSFSQHIALDELYEVLTKYTDLIAETSIGLQPGALDTLKQCEVPFADSDACLFICQLHEAVGELCEAVGEKSDALETTLDDLLRDVTIVKYKLENLH